jgi:amidophosphoribosyltransferase
VRYSTKGSGDWINCQPVVVSYRDGMMALAHNGSLVNTAALAREMGNEGSVFIADNDTELIVKLLARYLVQEDTVADAVRMTMTKAKGSYAIAMMMPGKLIAFRDPLGIRPLCLGKLNNSYLVASESCAITVLGGEFIRDIRPGEIIIIDENGVQSHQAAAAAESHLCIFEYVYFARPDSYIDNASVHRARLEAGAILAKESPAEADLVIGVPDSALSAALGFARESGIPYGHGLIRNRYVGRTFIQPTQGMRDTTVKIKFSPLRNEIEGKRIVMVDDSIVRGTTTRIIVQMLKNAGAKEVHLRISSPPVRFPCHYGIDTANAAQLIASKLSVDEIRQLAGADSLAYLSLEGLHKTPVGLNRGLCDACFTGDYCVPLED